MNINVPESARDHFWQEPPPGHREFWSFSRFKPPCAVGDVLIFRFDGEAVARAICSEIEPPGQSKCASTGRFERGWKVYWEPETFEDLRGSMRQTLRSP